MKRALIISMGSMGLLLASAAAGCAGGGGPASSPLDPFGTEPANATGTEPAGTNDEAPSPSSTSSLEQLCTTVCDRVATACPQVSGAATCATDCGSTNTMGCEVAFKTYLACLSTAPLKCTSDGLEAHSCDPAGAAIDACIRAGNGTGP